MHEAEAKDVEALARRMFEDQVSSLLPPHLRTTWESLTDAQRQGWLAHTREHGVDQKMVAADWRKRCLDSESEFQKLITDMASMSRLVASQAQELERYRALAETLQAERADKQRLIERSNKQLTALWKIQEAIKSSGV